MANVQINVHDGNQKNLSGISITPICVDGKKYMEIRLEIRVDVNSFTETGAMRGEHFKFIASCFRIFIKDYGKYS